MSDMVFFSGFMVMTMAELLWFAILLCKPITRWAESKESRWHHLYIGMVVTASVGASVAVVGLLMGAPI